MNSEQKSDALHELILSHISDAVFITDSSGQFTFVCPNVNVLFGYSRSEIQQLSNIRHILGENLFENEQLDICGELRNIEREIIDKWGRTHNVLVNVKRVSIQEGTLLYTCHDISDAYRQAAHRKQTEARIKFLNAQLEQQVRERTAELERIHQEFNQEIQERQRVEDALRESEARFRQLAEKIESVFWMIKPDLSELLYISPMYEQIWGRSCESFYQNPYSWFETMHPDDRDRMRASTEQAVQSGYLQAELEIEYRIVRPDGGIRWIRARAFPICDKDGHVYRVAGISDDITQRKQAEEELKQQQELLQTIFDHIPLMIALFNTQGQIQLINREWERVLGWSLAEVKNLDIWAECYPDPEYRQMVFDCIQDATTGWKDFKTCVRDGRILNTSWANVRLSDGRCIGIGQDISDAYRQAAQRKQVELQLEESESRLNAIVNSTSDGILIVDKHGIVRFANPAAAKLFGRTLKELLNHDFGEPILVGDVAELSLIRPGGEIGIGEMSVAQTEWQGEAVYIVSLRDITQRRQAEEALRESEERFRQLADNIQNVFWLFNPYTQELLYVSPAYETIWGRTCESIYAAPSNWLNTLHPEDQEIAIAAFTQQLQGESTHVEYRIIRPDGEIRWILARTFPIKNERHEVYRIAGIAEDISERKQAQEAMRQSEERFRAIFENAGIGIAVVGTDLKLVQTNMFFQQLLGYSTQELASLDYTDITYAEDLVIEQALAQECLAGTRDGYCIEKRFIRKDGEMIWGNLTVSIIWDTTGQFQFAVGMVENITERKQVEDALRASQARFAGILEIANDAIISVDAAQQITLFNQGAERIFGYAAQEVLGQPLSLLIPDRYADAHRQHVIYFSQSAGEARRMGNRREIWARCKDGSEFPAEASISMLQIGGETVFTAILRDVSERKQAEEALRQQMERERLLAQISQHIRQSLNLDQILNTTVHEVRQLLQADRALIFRLQPDKLGIVTHESVFPGLPSTVGHEYEDEKFPLDCYQNYCQGKARIVTDITLDETASCLFDYLQELGVISIISVPILHNNSEFSIRQSELALQQNSEAKIQNYSLWGLLIVHQCSQIRYWQSWEVNLLQQLATQVAIAIQQAELYRQLEIELNERKQAQAQLQQAKEAAEAANRAKSEFLANMSHELRTPLNTILGFAQLMTHERSPVNLAHSLSTQQQEYLGIISRSGEHLLSLINDILSMSKIESGKITLNENSFDLYRLLDTLEKMFQLKAAHKGLQLIFERTSDIPQYVHTDESKLRQVLTNLLGNAIKFTQSGRVTLRVARGLKVQSVTSEQLSVTRFGMGIDAQVKPTTCRDGGLLLPPSLSSDQLVTDNCSLNTVEGSGLSVKSEANLPPATQTNLQPATLRFEVEDTGPGIAPEEINSLFEAFVQTQTGRKSQSGTGLGLAISHRFVRMMGGDLTVSSIVGRGTIFKFDVCIHVAEAIQICPQQPQPQVIGLAPDQPQYRLLVVEDNLTNRKLLTHLLEQVGFEVREAQNGQEGVALWESWKPHLIWMDIRMPIMDGYQAIQQIRARESAGHERTTQEEKGQNLTCELHPTDALTPSPIPIPPSSATVIIAITASAFEEEIDRFLTAGCDDFVLKPFREDIILEKIAQHLGVCYLYKDRYPTSSSQSVVAQPLLTPEALAFMSEDWIAQLHQAARSLDAELMNRLIAQIPESHAPLAIALAHLIEDFRFDCIMELTQPAACE